MKYDRRQFMGAVAVTIAATLAEGKTVAPVNTSFGPVKQIDAEAGPTNGRPVILLHGL